MMNSLSASHARCEFITRNSGSSFYRSFALLRRDRRHAMTALYAFARMADDATDSEDSKAKSAVVWSAPAWHEWLDSLSTASPPTSEATKILDPIWIALADSVSKFSIPLESLHHLVRGVDTDSAPSPSDLDAGSLVASGSLAYLGMKNWDETATYCHRVASSVGIACLSIWAKTIGQSPSPTATQAALDCGVAFQMTNILRDIAEDSQRNRIYLPADELARFGIDSTRWLGLQARPSVFALNELGDWRGLMRLQIERTKALYESGWQVAHTLSLDGQRMFSLMWHSYRQLLSAIETAPELVWQSRIQLTKLQKVRIVGQHLFTPSFLRLLATHPPMRERNGIAVRQAWPWKGPNVAVVGAGLAGINAALHLARHGCRVTLIESKNRIGGRVGSFVDSETSQPIDYCQHVGMNCCSTLKQWIEDTDQSPFWSQQDSLHFASSGGKRIRVAAWPLPAPYHLAGLLFRWPQLRLSERIRVGFGLWRMTRLKRDTIGSSHLAIDWLRANGQTEGCIQNFWGTILVSALGEQVDRVTLGATHKVLVDGFASHRDAFHLLVPTRPLSEVLDESVCTTLRKLGVAIRFGQIVKGILKCPSNKVQLQLQGDNAIPSDLYDAVVLALPWNKVSDVLPVDEKPMVQLASTLLSSPITGIHTWWDRAWLTEPHAILINRLCQWVFPAPESHRSTNSPDQPIRTKEHYYQVVISASRDLPTGDAESILKIVKQDLAEIFPESAVATMLRGRVVTDPNAVFSVSVGHDAGRLDSNLLADKKIWLAGDWTATGWPATMEGALRSGALAAQNLLCAFGRDASLIEDSH